MDKTLTDAIAVAAAAGLTDRDLAAAVEAATQDRAAARPGLVPMTRPGLQPIYVADEAVEYYESLGLQREQDEAPAEAPAADDGLPKGNASREEWAAYALSRGLPAEELEPLTRDEIRDHFNEEN
jgi:hypothetical protein